MSATKTARRTSALSNLNYFGTKSDPKAEIRAKIAAKLTRKPKARWMVQLPEGAVYYSSRSDARQAVKSAKEVGLSARLVDTLK